MTDNKKVLKVLNGFIKLTDYEKEILIRELNEFTSSSYLEKGNIERRLQAKMNVGPLDSDICRCCGK